MESSECQSRGSHILVFPFPAQGHMLPILDFTHKLALHGGGGGGGLTITILVTPKNLPIIKPLLSKCPFIQTLLLPFPNHPSIPQGVENVKDLPPSYFSSMMRATSELYYPLLHWFQSHSSPPIAIISDFLLGWTNKLARQLGIPRIVFSPSGALTLSMMASIWSGLLKPKEGNQVEPANDCLVSFPQVPKCPTYPFWQLPRYYRTYKDGDPDSEFVKNELLVNSTSWGVVFNSFHDLEGVYLDHMKVVVGNQRVWSVGPLVPPPHDADDDESSAPVDRGGSNAVPANDILSWLDSCDDHSVVYVCFGSQAVLDNKQMEELAGGLEQSGVRFVWLVKEATTGHVSGDYGVVPTGFEDRMKGRGLVIRGWAPQVLILRHRSVGAFLTHCGWNSVLEALVAGVPMLAWPMGADQYFNATLLVDQMGIAIRVCEGETTIPNSVKLAKVMAESVSENSPRRAKAMELRKAALDAVKEGGSSFKDLDALMDALCDLKSSVEPSK